MSVVKTTAMNCLFCMICLNIATMWLNHVLWPGWGPDPFDVTNIMENTNLTEGVLGWDWNSETSSFYDIGYGLIMTVRLVAGIIFGFPSMLSQMGFPEWFIDPLNILWLMLFCLFFYLGIIAGRDI